ncbi:NUDIX domain-containing protein [Bacillus infantis]|uniref:NUDIX hydrolase n=1 Tax=Bacillus infantis TaxID=324767 RepID=UPI001CD6706D|nr:NUDIX domain-containing protein [Bacillus infantis]MCA1041556.1 NUDIX domain-containing protein [Bacillus infantis]
MKMITFGEKIERIEYTSRPAVYGLFFHPENGKVAVIQTGNGKYFLPGGGIETRETHEECMKREALEEMGAEIELGPFLGHARRYFYSTNEYKYYLSEGYFYLCEIAKQISPPLEEDHTLIWLDSLDAEAGLFHEHQRWAVKEALKKVHSLSKGESK